MDDPRTEIKTVIDQLRAALMPAIAHELAPLIASLPEGEERELGRRIAREAATAAARAVEPAIAAAERFLVLAVFQDRKLEEARRMIEALTPGATRFN